MTSAAVTAWVRLGHSNASAAVRCKTSDMSDGELVIQPLSLIHLDEKFIEVASSAVRTFHRCAAVTTLDDVNGP